jgi:hypothetical protein
MPGVVTLPRCAYTQPAIDNLFRKIRLFPSPPAAYRPSWVLVYTLFTSNHQQRTFRPAHEETARRVPRNGRLGEA